MFMYPKLKDRPGFGFLLEHMLRNKMENNIHGNLSLGRLAPSDQSRVIRH